MSGVRNPFAIRKSDGKTILIRDLSPNEYGLKCNCICPACNTEFVARNCEKSHRVSHFAHKDNKDCENAYTFGLYRLIHQILGSGTPFYIPSLIVSYFLPVSKLLNMNSIGDYIKIISESEEGYNNGLSEIISKGKMISFDKTELSYDSKNRIQAIELYIKEKSMAIKVMPPDTVCKNASISPYKDLATLVLDFGDDIEKIQYSKSEGFKEYLFSENLLKYWISNPLAETIYPKLLEKNKKEHEAYLERQERLTAEKNEVIQAKQIEIELEKKKWKRLEEKRKRLEEEQKKLSNEVKKIAEQQKVSEEKAKYVFAYEFVKDKFTQQDKKIFDPFGKRWIQCEICGEIKMESEFWTYGGENHANRGKCNECGK